MRICLGTTPAVAINNAGVVVEVHKSGSNAGLWCRVGQLNETTGDVDWNNASVRYDRGVTPTLRFERLDGSRLREIHASQRFTEQKWARHGSLNDVASGVDWERNGMTDSGLHDKSAAHVSGMSLTVQSAPEPGVDGVARVAKTLYYVMRVSSNNSIVARISFPKMAFVEYQEGNLQALVDDGAIFHANKAFKLDWIAGQRRQGHIVRQWGFNVATHGSQPPASFPATDYPFGSWYAEYMNTVDSVD